MATENSGTDGKQFSCGICIENYNTPRYLPTCGHTFCENCLLTYASNLQQQESKLDCPICRKTLNGPEDAQVTREWVQTFPLNTAIIKMMDAGSESIDQKTAEGRRKCDPCKERGETVIGLKFCMDCQEVYCKTCTDFHKAFKKLKDHRLINIQEVSAEASRADFFTSFTKCPNHPEREVEFFCKTHDAVICAVCLTSNHKPCDVVEISAYGTDITRLREESETLTSQFRAAIDHLNLLKQLKEESKIDMKKKLKEIREQIETVRDQVITLMDNVVGHVTEVTKQIEIENEDKLDEDMSRVSEIKLLTEGKIALLDTMEQHGSERHQFISAHLMKTQMEEVGRKISEEDRCLKNIDLELKIADDIREMIESNDVEKLVQVMVHESESSHKHLDAVLNYLRDSTLVCVEEHTVRLIVDNDFYQPRYWGIAIRKDACHGQVIVCERDNEYMCLYNPVYRIILKLKLNHPSSATQIDDTHIAVSIPDDKTISIVTVGSKLRVEKTIKTRHKPWRLVSLSNGQLAVAWKDPPAFGVIDISGTEMVQKLYFHQDKSGQKLDQFDFMAVDEKRHHVIQTVNGTNVVQCFDFSGEFVFQYTDPKLKNVRGVAVDKCGNIYVCSCAVPGSIHKLSPAGEQIAVITEGIPSYPWAICRDNGGTGFWVTNDYTASRENILYFRLEWNT